MANTVILKCDTAANWAKAKGFIPKKGEVIMYSDMEPPFKIGDGIHNVNDLPFINQQQIWNDFTNQKGEGI